MQNNNVETNIKPCSRSSEPAREQQTTAFKQRQVHSRFSVTPESMGLDIPANSALTSREPQQEPPLVDVKSYYERHNMKQSVGNLTGFKPHPSTSNHSSQSNTQTSSYGSIKTENISQLICSSNNNSKSESIQDSTSPKLSPKSPLGQWSFDRVKKDNPEQQSTSYKLQSNVYSCNQSSQPLFTTNNSFIPGGSSNLKSSSSVEHMSSCLPSPSSMDAQQCTHYSHLQNVSSLSEIPTEYYKLQLQKFRSGSDASVGDTTKANYANLNEIFLNRLQDIDAEACGDNQLKLVTYQEWVDMLLKINESFITNMEELEREVAERLELVQRRVNTNCRHSQGNELMKCRKDIDTLLKLIQNDCHYNNWNLQGITFETITPAQVLGVADFEHLNMEGNVGTMKNCTDAESMQRNKLFANIKALAHEVAEKHDEVIELKRQVICMEDEIQKAQKKIQLKDDVIKELRNDLKSSHNKFCTNNSLEINLNMPPINFENQTSRSANTQLTECNTLTFQDDSGSQFDSLSHTEHEEQQKLKVLEEELNDYFEMNNECNKHKMETQRKKLKEIFQKFELEKATAYRKLDFIRRQLIDLKSSAAEGINDSDSGSYSKIENEQDAKILDAVRKRLRKLDETNIELKKRVQKLEMEKSEISTTYQSEKTFSESNSQALKQIADLLCGMRGKPLSYTDIYNTNPNKLNPFCEAIMDMQNGFQERETQLLSIVGMKNKQIQELGLSLLKNEKDYSEEKSSRLLKDINKTTLLPLTTTTSLSAAPLLPPPPPPQITSIPTLSTLLSDLDLNKTSLAK